VGDVRTGRVISVADFGAFVDLGGADGLVHLTELSWQHVTHPREVVEVGQEVEVEVINIDPERKRIGLSMKRQANDPWLDIVRGYHMGQLVQATVTKLTKFGAFARLVDAPEIEGLIHISELADYRVTHPREVVLVGDVLTLRIVKIEPEQRRLGLSLRQVDSAKFMDQDWDALAEEIEYGAPHAEDEAPTTLEDVQAEEAPTALESVQAEEAPADMEEAPAPAVSEANSPSADEPDDDSSGDATAEPDAEDPTEDPTVE
jgi:small subunit ribosomal protein S1